MAMKKFPRLISVCLISSLMVVLINVALAGWPASKSRASEFGGQSHFDRWAGPAPVNQSLLQIEPITGLSITHTSPVFARFPTRFIASITGGTPPIGYIWSFGDGPAQPPGTAAVFTHTYATTGTFTVVVTAFNALGSVAQTISVTAVETPYRVHLPLVLKEFTPPLEPADLVCDLSLYPPAPLSENAFVVNVKIRNLRGGSADGFWVDLYINPTELPNQYNLFPWPQACGPSPCPRGIAWGISDTPLGSGITRTLVSIPNTFHPDGFDPAHSMWTGSLPPGTYNLYAYADSIDRPQPDNISGAVLETNEDNNLCEILDLVIPPPGLAKVDRNNSNSLPVRPGP